MGQTLPTYQMITYIVTLAMHYYNIHQYELLHVPFTIGIGTYSTLCTGPKLGLIELLRKGMNWPPTLKIPNDTATLVLH